MRENHIPYVHNERDATDIERFNEYKSVCEIEFQGKKVEFVIYNFKNPETLAEETQMALYFTGFPQIETQKPTDITAELLERSSNKGQVLIIPRFKEIPNSLHLESDVVLSALSTNTNPVEGLENSVAPLRGLLAKHLESQQIQIDFTKQDIEIISYSSGSNVGLEVAAAVNDITPQQRTSGAYPNRTLISLSSSAAIDEIPYEETATGKSHAEAFNKQVTWAVMEETRLRLNSIVDREHRKFNSEAHKWIAEHGITENAQEFARLQKLLLDRKTEDGVYEFPFLRNGMEHIDDAPEAFDAKTMQTTAQEFLKLLKFKEGRTELVAHVKESAQENLGMLFDVLRRASTGSGQYTYEQLTQIPEVKLALIGVSAAKKINPQFIPAEHRIDDICDHLETFDVKAVWPVEDLIAPTEAYGKTIRRLLTRPNAPISMAQMSEQLTQDLSTHTDEQLGETFKENSDQMGRILFPAAKSVDIRFEGKKGHMSGSHLAPMKNAKPYFEN